MLDWKDVTGSFSEDSRHWKGRYLEVCEVAADQIECSLFSCEDDDWEIYINYGIMYGVSYASASQATTQREQMKKEIEEEYAKNGEVPSDDFINSFSKKYKLDVMNALF